MCKDYKGYGWDAIREMHREREDEQVRQQEAEVEAARQAQWAADDAERRANDPANMTDLQLLRHITRNA